MSGKKKWSKAQNRDKVDNLVLFDTKTHDRLRKEVPKMKVITQATLTERLKINGSLARKAIKVLVEEGVIKPVHVHHRCSIYTRATATEAEGEAEE